MLGKIVIVGSVLLIFIAYTGVNAMQYYQDYVVIRDQTQPLTDNLVEKALTAVSHSDLKSKIQELTRGKL